MLRYLDNKAETEGEGFLRVGNRNVDCFSMFG